MSGETIRVKFEGIDSWNRPVFRDVTSHIRLGDTDHLFSYGVTGKEVLEWYRSNGLNLCSYLVFFGSSFDCEPDGSSVKKSIEVIQE
jgi:hypothetical protein